MSTTDFLPTREPELVTWSDNFSALITADPVVYGVDMAQAANFATLNTAWVDAYNIANSNKTRTPTSIVTKNIAKDAMINDARKLARMIHGTPSVTDIQKMDLGLSVRGKEQALIAVPDSPPQLEVLSRVGHTVTIRLHDLLTPGFRKPKGVQGATVFSYVGASPPISLGDWNFEGQETRTKRIDVNFSLSLPASTQVWLAAFWYNPRGQAGPPNVPVTTNLDSVVTAAA